MTLKRIFTTSVVAFVIAGCGGGGGNTPPQATNKPGGTTNPPTTQNKKLTSGKVSDGYIAGANVLVDINTTTKGQYDSGDYNTTTNANGDFDIPSTLTVANGTVIYANGGKVVSTGKDFNGTLKGVFDGQKSSIVLSPVTTMVATLVENGKSTEDAKQKVADALGITKEKVTADPVTDDDALKAVQKVVAIAKVVQTDSNKSVSDIVEDIAKNLDNDSNLTKAVKDSANSEDLAKAALDTAKAVEEAIDNLQEDENNSNSAIEQAIQEHVVDKAKEAAENEENVTEVLNHAKDNIENNNFKDIVKAVSCLTFDKIKGNNSDANSVITDLNLTAKSECENNLTIAWVNSSSNIDLSSGAVTRANYDNNLSFVEANVSKGDKSQIKPIYFTVLAKGQRPSGNGGSLGDDYPHYPERIGEYVVGTIVYGTDGKLYQCPRYPSWCNGASIAYAPGSGYAWEQAWEIYKKDEHSGDNGGGSGDNNGTDNGSGNGDNGDNNSSGSGDDNSSGNGGSLNNNYPHYPEGIGEYVVGTIVYGTDGKLYQCPRYPSWCNGASIAYAPGSGYAWEQAWELYKKDDNGRGSGDDNSTDNGSGNGDNNSSGSGDNNNSGNGNGGDNNSSDSNGDNNNSDNNGGVKDHFVVGYLPSWSINWFTQSSASDSQMVNIDPLYTHIVISFAKPDLTYSDGSFTDTGINFSASFAAVKKAIELLHQKGKKVFLAVGGATYNNWTGLIDEQGKAVESTVHKKALVALAKALKIDGIDVDYELPGADSASVAKYYKAVLSLHEAAEVAGIKLSIAGWSTGADCTALTTSDASCQNRISYWGGNAGRERTLFNKLKRDGYNLEQLFDYVSVMSYDGGVNRFDPVVLYKNYRSIYAGKLAIGFELPKEAWGGAEIVASNSDATACESTSMVNGNSYITYAQKQPYSVERFVGYINRDAHSGVMLWSLYKQKSATQCSQALDNNGLNEALKRYLGKESNDTIIDDIDDNSSSGNGSGNGDNGGGDDNSSGGSSDDNSSGNGGSLGDDYPHYPEGKGEYVVGTIVYGTNGKLYRCPKYPSWCNGAAIAYAPGSGYAWEQAWELYKKDEHSGDNGGGSGDNNNTDNGSGNGDNNSSGNGDNNSSSGDGNDNNNSDNGSGNSDNNSTGDGNGESRSVVNSFEVVSKELGWTSKIVIKYTGNRPLDLKGSSFVLKGYEIYKNSSMTCEGVSWFSVAVDGNSSNEKYYTTIEPQIGDDSWIDSKIEKGQSCTISFSPSVIDKYSADDFDLYSVGIVVKGVENSSGINKPYRDDPVSLKVKGWPATLAMGTVTDNAMSSAQALYDSTIESIFKYDGDGFGDRGTVITPNVSLQTVHLARAVEALDTTGKREVMPTLIVYTANGSGGGLAPEDIINRENLIKHYRNLIRLAAALQAQKDAKHPHPATIVLNPDLFGEWQKNRENGSFQETYCGGKSDKECKTLKVIAIRDALKEAIDAEKNYKVQRYNGDQLVDYKTIAELYDLEAIKNSIDTTLEDNIKGWVQSQNLTLKLFAKDVPFSWLINLWAPGSANWVHKRYPSEGALWNAASASVVKFLKFIGAYEGAYRPDFLTFDKYERDGFGAAGRGNYAFNATAWDNYLMYVKQITDAIDTPAMIWQIPGGHMPTKSEDYSEEAHLCASGESSGCFDPLVHSASGGTYFMGDKNIGYNIDNIIDEVLNIPLFGAHYSYGTDEKVDSVKKLLEIDEKVGNKHDWSKPQLRKAVDSNAFAILWGGGETTGAVPISTNKTGGYAWLSRKIQAYERDSKIPLYHINNANGSTKLTSLDSLNRELTGLSEKMNNEVLLYDTGNGFVPSTIYKWEDFLDALRVMHNSGVAGDRYWLFDANDDENKKSLYAKTAIAAFLAQSMQETIQYDACDENSWQFIKDTATSEAVKQSYERGDFSVDLPMDAACGQLGQDYESYGVDVYGVDNPYSCPKAPNMEVTAVTNAKYYGAAGPLFAGPDTLFEEAGFYVDDKPGRWEYNFHCEGAPALDSNFTTPKMQAWEREECKIYKGQKAGKYVWDGSSKRSLQGCVWWGRGVIQTTGRENFGKLNHYLGRSHVDKTLIGKKVDWADTKVEVTPAPKNPLYADIDFCATPESICSSKKHKELKWIAGLFYWMNSVQAYKGTGKYSGWNYYTELKKYVDSNFGKNNYQPLNGISFIDAISGIVNRGCPDTTCPVSGMVHAGPKRKENFLKVLQAFGIEAQ